jgi:hypothetical protein
VRDCGIELKTKDACKHGLLDYHPLGFASGLLILNVHTFGMLTEEDHK